MKSWSRRAGLVLVVLALTPSLWAQESVAVIGATSAKGEPPPYELVAAIEVALGEQVAVNDRSALTALSMTQNADPGESVISAKISELGTAVDAFYNTPEQAELLLLEAVDSTKDNVLWLADQPLLVEQLKVGHFTLVRAITARAAFEEAQKTMFDAMARYPLWVPSTKSYPPDIINLSTQAASQVLALGYRLKLNRVGTAVCQVNVNGDAVVLDTPEREVAIANGRAYGIKLSCGSQGDAISVGPFLVSAQRVNTPLYLSPSILEAMKPLSDSKPPVLPEKPAQIRGLSTNLLSILGSDALLVVSRGGDGLMLVQATPEGVTWVTTAETTQDPGTKMMRALLEGKPTVEVAIDKDGTGFKRLEAPEPPALWPPIVVGSVGVGLIVAGGVLMGLAASSDNVDLCREKTCTVEEFDDKVGGLATMEVAGLSLLGAGGLAVVGAVWLALVLSDDGVESADSVSFGVGPMRGGAAATMMWRF